MAHGQRQGAHGTRPGRGWCGCALSDRVRHPAPDRDLRPQPRRRAGSSCIRCFGVVHTTWLSATTSRHPGFQASSPAHEGVCPLPRTAWVSRGSAALAGLKRRVYSDRRLCSASQPLQGRKNTGSTSQTELALEVVDTEVALLPFPLQGTKGHHAMGDMMQLRPFGARLTAC
jgi:hypothetical protein